MHRCGRTLPAVLITIAACPQQEPSGNFRGEKVYYLQVPEITEHTWGHGGVRSRERERAPEQLRFYWGPG